MIQMMINKSDGRDDSDDSHIKMVQCRWFILWMYKKWCDDDEDDGNDINDDDNNNKW